VKAYERAERGLDLAGAVFKVAETKEDGLKMFTTKRGGVA
jgi:hypothetical protein